MSFLKRIVCERAARRIIAIGTELIQEVFRQEEIHGNDGTLCEAHSCAERIWAIEKSNDRNRKILYGTHILVFTLGTRNPGTARAYHA
jgi:hypothetical protein